MTDFIFKALGLRLVDTVHVKLRRMERWTQCQNRGKTAKSACARKSNWKWEVSKISVT